MEILNIISLCIGILGVLVLMWGVISVIIKFVLSEFFRLRSHAKQNDPRKTNYLRRDLGVYILFSLEFMIAADIIHTVIKPDMDSLIVLGVIVVIRTVIAYFLNKEIESSRAST